MKIAMVSADRGIAPGGTKGASQHLRGVAASLSDMDHEVTLFSGRQPEGAFPVEVRSIGELRGNPDLVYERYSLGHQSGLDWARAICQPFVLEVNAPLVDEASMHRPGTTSGGDAAAERRLLAEADLVVVVSSTLQRWVRDMGRSGPTIVVPNGFEPTWFVSDEPVVGPDVDLVFIGHPKPWHGADRIANLVAHLCADGHDPTALVIGGGSGVETLVAAADHHGVSDRIEVTGALPPEQASVMLRRGRVALAPYRFMELFYFCPLKVIDYLAAGLPVVASRVGDVPELVGDAGVLVEARDDAALAGAVGALLADPGRAAELGRRGRRRAHHAMTWRHRTESILHATAGLMAS